MRVLVFGDSITQGFWDVDGGWVSRIRKQYDRQEIEHLIEDAPTVFNLGIAGDSSDDVLVRFDAETKARLDEEMAFIFAIGVNDARTKDGVNFSNVEKYKSNLKEILDLAKKYSNRILFVGITPCVEARANPVSWSSTGYTNSRIKEFDDTLKDFCGQNQTGYVEIFEPFSILQSKEELLPDGVHPNDRGHQLIADIVAPAIDTVLQG